MEDQRESPSSDSKPRRDNRRPSLRPMEPNIWEDKSGLRLPPREVLDHQEMVLDNRDKSLMNPLPSSLETSASRLMSTHSLTSSDNAETSSVPESPRERTEEAEDSDMLSSEEEMKSKRPLSWLEPKWMEDKSRSMLPPQDKEVVETVEEDSVEVTVEEELPVDSEDQEEEDLWEVEEEESP